MMPMSIAEMMAASNEQQTTQQSGGKMTIAQMMASSSNTQPIEKDSGGVLSISQMMAQVQGVRPKSQPDNGLSISQMMSAGVGADNLTQPQAEETFIGNLTEDASTAIPRAIEYGKDIVTGLTGLVKGGAQDAMAALDVGGQYDSINPETGEEERVSEEEFEKRRSEQPGFLTALSEGLSEQFDDVTTLNNYYKRPITTVAELADLASIALLPAAGGLKLAGKSVGWAGKGAARAGVTAADVTRIARAGSTLEKAAKGVMVASDVLDPVQQAVGLSVKGIKEGAGLVGKGLEKVGILDKAGRFEREAKGAWQRYVELKKAGIDATGIDPEQFKRNADRANDIAIKLNTDADRAQQVQQAIGMSVKNTEEGGSLISKGLEKVGRLDKIGHRVTGRLDDEFANFVTANARDIGRLEQEAKIASQRYVELKKAGIDATGIDPEQFKRNADRANSIAAGLRASADRVRDELNMPTSHTEQFVHDSGRIATDVNVWGKRLDPREWKWLNNNPRLRALFKFVASDKAFLEDDIRNALIKMEVIDSNTIQTAIDLAHVINDWGRASDEEIVYIQSKLQYNKAIAEGDNVTIAGLEDDIRKKFGDDKILELDGKASLARSMINDMSDAYVTALDKQAMVMLYNAEKAGNPDLIAVAQREQERADTWKKVVLAGKERGYVNREIMSKMLSDDGFTAVFTGKSSRGTDVTKHRGGGEYEARSAEIKARQLDAERRIKKLAPQKLVKTDVGVEHVLDNQKLYSSASRKRGGDINTRVKVADRLRHLEFEWEDLARLTPEMKSRIVSDLVTENVGGFDRATQIINKYITKESKEIRLGTVIKDPEILGYLKSKGVNFTSDFTKEVASDLESNFTRTVNKKRLYNVMEKVEDAELKRQKRIDNAYKHLEREIEKQDPVARAQKTMKSVEPLPITEVMKKITQEPYLENLFDHLGIKTVDQLTADFIEENRAILRKGISDADLMDLKYHIDVIEARRAAKMKKVLHQIEIDASSPGLKRAAKHIRKSLQQMETVDRKFIRPMRTVTDDLEMIEYLKNKGINNANELTRDFIEANRFEMRTIFPEAAITKLKKGLSKAERVEARRIKGIESVKADLVSYKKSVRDKAIRTYSREFDRLVNDSKKWKEKHLSAIQDRDVAIEQRNALSNTIEAEQNALINERIREIKQNSPDDYASEILRLMNDESYTFDASFNAANTYQKVGRMINDTTFQNSLASNKRVARPVPDEEFAYQVSGKQYGALDGMFMKEDQFADLMAITKPGSMFADNSTFIKVFDSHLGSALRAWKMGKTVLYPKVWVRNFVSNFHLAELGGLSPYTKAGRAAYIEAVRGILRDSDAWRKYKRAGGASGNFSTELLNEYVDRFDRYLKNNPKSNMMDAAADAFNEMEKAHGFGKKALEKLKRAGSSLDEGMNKAAEAYGFVDTFHKFALSLYKQAEGMDAISSVAYAKKYLFDYADVPDMVKYGKRFYQAFMTFNFKYFPIFAESLINRPLTTMKYIAMLEAINMLGKYGSGDPEDWERKFRGSQRDQVGDWRVEYGGTGTFAVPGEASKLFVVDLNSVLPFLAAMDTNKNGVVPQMFMPNHPGWTMAYIWGMGYEPYYDRSLLTFDEKMEATLRLFEPGLVTSWNNFAKSTDYLPGVDYEMLASGDIRNAVRMGKMIHPRYQTVMTTWQAALKMLGVSAQMMGDRELADKYMFAHMELTDRLKKSQRKIVNARRSGKFDDKAADLKMDANVKLFRKQLENLNRRHGRK